MNRIVLLTLGLIVNVWTYGQGTPQGVSIANDQVPPAPNAMLDVVSNEKGILVPRVTYATIGTSGALAPSIVAANPDEAGLLVFVSDATANHGYWYFDHVDDVWRKLGSSNFQIEILSWEEMHDLVVTNNDLGKLVYVTDCQYTCNGLTATVRGLYYYDGVKLPYAASATTGCNPVRRWIRVTDGFSRPKCWTSYACPLDSELHDACGGFVGGHTGSLDPLMHLQDDLAQLSDSTLKVNVRAIEDPIEKIERINGVYYSWSPEYNGPGERQIGVIAQNVARVFPEAVSQMEGGKLGVKYELLVAPLIEATKAQQQLIDEQSERIEQLEQQVQELLKRMEAEERK